MARVNLNLFGGYYTHPSKPISVQNSVNLVPVVIEANGLSQSALMKRSGISLYASLSGVNRGSIVMAGVAYFVNGSSLYSIASDGVSTNLGTISGAGRVSMAHNGSKLCIVVPNGTAYVYDGASLVTISDPDYRASDTVVYKDGYFVFTSSDGAVFFNSALNDPSNIDPLDFGTAEISPDKIISQYVNHNELFILGETTTEIFQNIGGSGFPFQRIQGAVIEKGCFARFTPIEFDNSFVFVGGGRGEGAAIWRVVSSNTAQKISTDAIDNEIQQFNKEELKEAFSFSYAIDGQFIVGFTFTSSRIASATYCYNATSKQWFEMRSGLNANKWRVNSIVKAYDKLLCGDSEGGNVGEIKNIQNEYDNLIKCERTTQPFIIDGTSQCYPELELFIENGVGLTSGEAPQIRMAYSDDGGRTFSQEQTRSFGKIGEYNKRSVWRRVGRVPRDRVLRFTVTDNVEVNMMRLDAVIEKGYA